MDEEVLVKVERDEGWASVAMNRPHRKNAMTGPMMDQLADAIDALSADVSIAAIVFRGEGGSFSSGVDLTELQAVPHHPWVPEFRTSLRRVHLALFECACPIVVALEKYGINGSTALALSADLLVVGETSFLQIGEIAQGAHLPMNAAWMRLKTDEHTLSRMALMGDRVPGPELLRLGLAHEVVADTEVRSRAEALATRLASLPEGSARNVKSDIRAQRHVDPETWFPNVESSALLSADQIRS